MKTHACLLLTVAACAGLAELAPAVGQDAVPPAFEAVSVRPQEGNPGFIPSSPTRFVDVNATLRSLITWSWNVRGFQVEGGPDWAGARRFDVSATTPRPVTEATMRLMVRQMLAERFGLRIRLESRDMPRYVLRLARADGRLGPQLTRAALDCSAVLASRFGAPAPPGSNAPACQWRAAISSDVARMMVDGAPMREFAGLLERVLDRKVVDGTGLAGAFDIRLEFSADQMPIPLPPVDSGTPPPRDGLSLVTALREQLGLELDASRGPVDIIVIESARLPAPN